MLDRSPIVANTIPQLVREAANRYGTSEAIVDNGIRMTFADLNSQVRRMAEALQAWGLRRGDRVGLWGPNWWEWAVAALGVHTAGGVVVPINTRFKGQEAAFVLRQSDARLLFCATGFLGIDHLDLLQQADGGVPKCIKQVVALRTPVPPNAMSFEDFVTQPLGPGDISGTDLAPVAPSDTCHIMFTSGTTGLPKGVLLNHEAICRAYRSWASVIGLRHGDRYLIVNPFFHSFGLNAGILACLMTGATMLPHAVFDVESVMKRIPQERVTVLPGPPAIYQSILNHQDLNTFDMSTLRLAVTGAAPVPVPMIEAMREQLNFEVVVTGYGLTEASGIATMCRHDDAPEVISATSGRAIEDVEVRVIDSRGEELSRGEPGEIVVRGYNVMDGYLGDPDATRDVIDERGWLHTGDIGTMDSAGYIAITDRLKDMFICGGFNAYPAEIESVMLAHDAVGQVAVVGQLHDRLGEVGHAFVVPTPMAAKRLATSTTELEGAILAWSRERLANYKVPRAVTFCDQLPLTASGKVQKHELRKRLTNA